MRGTNPIGIAIGTLVNLVWEPLSDLLFDDYDDSDTRAYDANKAGRSASAAITAAYGNALRAADLEARMKWETVRRLASESMDADELRAIAEWAKTLAREIDSAQQLIPDPRQVGWLLIARWHAQRTGKPGRANRETDPGTYRAVGASLVTKRMDEGTSLFDVEAQTGLFLEQMRYAWGRLGVELDGPMAKAQAIYNAFRRRGPDELARGFGGTTFNLSAIASPTAFAATVAKSARVANDGVLGAHAASMPEDLAAAAQSGVFRLTCQVQLEESNGAVVVSDFNYELVPEPANDAVLCAEVCRDVRPGEVQGPYLHERKWHDSPLR